MRHRKSSFKIGHSGSYRRAMLMNIVNGLFAHERIKTTKPKAKEARKLAEKMITLAKKNTLHARRLAISKLRDKKSVGILFSKYGERYAERNGGYTRIIKLERRKSDDAEMVYLELVDRLGAETDAKKTKGKKAAAPKPEKAETPKAEEKTPEAAPVEETTPEEPSAVAEESVEEVPEESVLAEEKPEEGKNE
jgi:large subunit ribosomal protein L17